MTTFQDTLTARTLTAVKTAQDIAVDATKTVADVVTPYLPSFDALPFAEKLPAPAEVVEKAFDLTTVVLAGVRNVAVEATKAWTQASPKASAPKASAPKATAPKTSAPAKPAKANASA